jgi:hypothetical protein
MPTITSTTSFIPVPTVDQPTRKFNYCTISCHTDLGPQGNELSGLPKRSHASTVAVSQRLGHIEILLDVFDYADHCTLSVMLGENALTPYLLLERANSQAGTWRRWTIPYFSATSVEEKLSFRFECVPIEPKDRYQADMVSYLYLDDLSVSLNRAQSPFG